jgi:hypothetical protein
MMSAHLTNPYARDTPEHMLWARWHRAFFDQPVHGQLLAIESLLRHNLSTLLKLNAKAAPSEVQREMHSRLMEVEEHLDLLDEAAEHAFVRIVSRGPAAARKRHTI